MFVYVVSKGTRCEGGDVVDVFKTKKAALRIAKAQRPCFPGGWQPDGEDEWINGCDYVKVERWKVE